MHFLSSRFTKDPTAKVAEASAALRSYEDALPLTPKRAEQLSFFKEMAWAAYVGDEQTKAEMYASAMVKEVKKGDRLYGDAAHQGQTVLGLLALDRHQVKSATAHLLASADVPTTPLLGSTGPSLVLARRLLVAGEKRAVVEYLTACKSLWPVGRPQLALWISQITNGERCEFKGAMPD